MTEKSLLQKVEEASSQPVPFDVECPAKAPERMDDLFSAPEWMGDSEPRPPEPRD